MRVGSTCSQLTGSGVQGPRGQHREHLRASEEGLRDGVSPGRDSPPRLPHGSVREPELRGADPQPPPVTRASASCLRGTEVCRVSGGRAWREGSTQRRLGWDSPVESPPLPPTWTVLEKLCRWLVCMVGGDEWFTRLSRFKPQTLQAGHESRPGAAGPCQRPCKVAGGAWRPDPRLGVRLSLGPSRWGTGGARLSWPPPCLVTGSVALAWFFCPSPRVRGLKTHPPFFKE